MSVDFVCETPDLGSEEMVDDRMFHSNLKRCLYEIHKTRKKGEKSYEESNVKEVKIFPQIENT